MTRWIFLGFLLVVGALLFSMARLQKKNDEVPHFLRYDTLAVNANPRIELEVVSLIEPTEEQLDILKKDYAAIWAHLNRMYQYPDPKPSKERFTERFYLHLAKNFKKGDPGSVVRSDSSHHIQVVTWSKDGLSCNLLDQNAAFNYTFPDGSVQSSSNSIAISLLFQGDNWRLDAIKFID